MLISQQHKQSKYVSIKLDIQSKTLEVPSTQPESQKSFGAFSIYGLAGGRPRDSLRDFFIVPMARRCTVPRAERSCRQARKKRRSREKYKMHRDGGPPRVFHAPLLTARSARQISRDRVRLGSSPSPMPLEIRQRDRLQAGTGSSERGSSLLGYRNSFANVSSFTSVGY